MSLKLPSDLKQRLQNISALRKRPAHALAREAVEMYILQEEAREQRNREAEAAWKHYQDTGIYYDGEEAIAWLRSLTTPAPHTQPQPLCER